MSCLVLILLSMLLLPCCRRLHTLRRAGAAEAAARLYRQTARALGILILLAMAAQELILLLAGQLSWRTGLPLHLCSLMGVIALPGMLSRRDLLRNALFFAGLPGAALALLFPAVAGTPWPEWTAFFFCLMHAGITWAALLPLFRGWRPRPRGAAEAGFFLLSAGLAALAVNRLTGGNYLFLTGPVAGTPLVFLARWGRGIYLLLLSLLAALLLGAEAAGLSLLRKLTKSGRLL